MSRRNVETRIDKLLAEIKKETCGPAESGPIVDPFVLTPDDDYLRAAFEAAGLSPENRDHWARLARAMAKGRFGANKPGAPIRWDSISWSSLLQNFLRVRGKSSNPSLSDLAICRILVKNIGHFRGVAPGTLRRNLSLALNPDRNFLLKHVLASFPAQYLASDQKHRTCKKTRPIESLPDHFDEVKRGLASRALTTRASARK